MSKVLLSIAAASARWLPMPVKRSIYRFGPIAQMIRRSLNKAAPRGLTVVKVAGGTLLGYRLQLDLQAEKDYWLGTYEPELQAAVMDLVQPGAQVYDVGANIGYVSLLLAHAVGPLGRVVSFEALPGNVERLRTNIALNGLGGRVEVEPAAVVDNSHPVRFLIGPSGGMGKAAGSAGREEVTYAGEIEVPGLSLDQYVYEEGHAAPQVVKMDIEGGEVLAMPGMRRLLVEAHPLILMELHGPQAARVAWQELTAAGYQLASMQPPYPPVRSMEDLDWKAYLVAHWTGA